MSILRRCCNAMLRRRDAGERGFFGAERATNQVSDADAWEDHTRSVFADGYHTGKGEAGEASRCRGRRVRA